MLSVEVRDSAAPLSNSGRRVAVGARGASSEPSGAGRTMTTWARRGWKVRGLVLRLPEDRGRGARGSVSPVRNRIRLLLGAIALGLGVLAMYPEHAVGQTITSTTSPSPPTSSIPAVPTTSPPATERDIDVVRAELDSLRQLLNLAIIPISFIIGIGGVVSVIFSVRDQRRVSQLHELAIGNESSSQRRTEESYSAFLDSSQKTLNLVNDTLALAKESSERAATTMQLKAKRALSSIDQEATDVLEKIGDDMKVVVTDGALRARLQHVANDLAAIEGYLMLQDIDITPGCLWIKGMDLHLSHDARGARLSLRKAATEARQRDLKVLALYWLGYLQNNSGNYMDAARLFRDASTEVQPNSARAVELQRIQIESEFFALAEGIGTSVNVDERQAASLAVTQRLETLISSIPANIASYDAAKRYSCATLANVLTWASDLGRDPAEVTQDKTTVPLLKQAMTLYADAKGSHERLWPMFGMAESNYFLTGSIQQDRYARLEQLIVDEQRTRTEPRNNANLQQAKLIVRLRISGSPTDERVKEAYSQVQGALSAVDEATTVFSQLQKRNLSRRDFADEASRLVVTATPPLQTSRPARKTSTRPKSVRTP